MADPSPWTDPQVERCRCLAAARAYAEAGLSIIPIKGDGSKMPLVAWKERQLAPASPEQVTEWFAGDRHGMALVAGRVSGGIELLEFEGRAIAEGLHHRFRELCVAAGLGELLDRVMRGCTHRSPSGGIHLLVRTDAPGANQVLARRPAAAAELAERADEPSKVLIETRGEGGYLIVPPSHGSTHASGEPWVTLHGSLTEVETITSEERDALFDSARSLDAVPAAEHATPHGTNAERPGDRYNSAPDVEARMEALLVAHGWAVVHRQDRVAYIRRPGKDIGVSATIGRHPGLFYVFSTSTTFEAPRGYSPFAVHAILEHGGDFAAAARAIGEEERYRGGTRAGPRDGDGPEERGSVGSVPPDGWPETVPLLPDAPLPPFPVEHLPPWMRDMVGAVAANTETDPSMAAVTALGLSSVPLSNRFAVRAEAWAEKGVNLFACAIADSGELKSAVVDHLAEPLRRHERDRQADEQPLRRDRELTRRDIEARAAIARDELKKAMKAEVTARAAVGQAPEDDDDGEDAKLVAAQRRAAAARAQVRAIERELEADGEETVKPYVLLADDATQEALQRQMAEQDGRVGMVSAESELFPMAAGRYSDKGPSLQVYLSGFSGEPLRAERITRVAPPVDHPGLSIVITTQPVVMEQARANDYLQRRGLLARFLFAVPVSRAGHRRLAGRPIIPVSVEREYRETLMRLCRLGDGHSSSSPVDLRLSAEAGRALVRWHDEVLEPRRDRERGDLGGSEHTAMWASRHHGLVLRVAGLLHVALHLEEAAGLAIEVDTVTAAIAIGEWGVEHALAAFGIDRLDRVGQDALRVRRWYRLRQSWRDPFTIRDATRALRGFQAARVRDAVLRLEDHGYVRLDRTKAGPVGGRPSDVVTVNPADEIER